MLKQYRHAVSARGLIQGRTGETSAVASEIAVAVIGGVSGLVSGGIVTLVAPWSSWGIEKRRLRREHRVKRIAEWRAGASQLGEDVHFMELEWSPWYVTLLPEMRRKTIEAVDAASQGSSYENYNVVATLIIEEIAYIEREKWELV